ncbi:MAG: hypothetical protein KKD39_06265 [Candidatus Altiarchaeota archaeon]|nr:hypothetical protein [Candidatus Altiarchaeota archaeon]
MEKKYEIGGFEITDAHGRLVFYRAFPETYLDVSYNEIENMQHITELNWQLLTKSLLLFCTFVVLYLNQAGVYIIAEVIKSVMPELAEKIPIYAIMVIIWLVLITYGVLYLGMFMMSFRGRFMISRKKGNPIVIHTKLTPEVRQFIDNINEEVDLTTKGIVRHGPIPRAPEEKGVVKVMTDYWGNVLGLGRTEDRKKQEYNTEEKKEYIAETKSDSELNVSQVKVRNTSLRELDNIQKRRVVLVLTRGDDHSLPLVKVLSKMVKENNIGGVYLSFTMPSEYIISNMEDAKIPSENVYFIDCISIMAGKVETVKNEKVAYVENPASLEDITLHMDSMLSKVKTEKKFIFLDSLSSLSIYNSDKSVKEFTHYIINKIRLHELIGIILAVEKKETEELVRIITPMCDHQIRL